MFLTFQIEQICVKEDTCLREVITTIQQGNKQIALVVDAAGRLLGTITDGDIRRAILRGASLDAATAGELHHGALTAHVNDSPQLLFELMRDKSLRHIPLVNDDGILVDLVWISDFIKQDPINLSAVVMAGGFGTRLHPLTANLPKPMLPVNNKPLLEHIVLQLKQAGINNIHLTTHYKGDIIARHFGDGRDFGVAVHYVTEDQPLGTAGAVGLVEMTDEPLLVMNGDILTQVNLRAARLYTP